MDQLVQDEHLDTVRAALAPRFRIEREIGRGGMATVYLAYDARYEREVAIKVLRSELAAAVWRDRFFLEIKLTARLSHPHILKLLESDEVNGLLYYVMPYVWGESLRQRIRRERQLPLEDALRITREVAEALAAAHAQGIVHRDIKPENILFEGEHALVADFGIAKAITEAAGERLSTTGLRIGTPGYMSPEQATGEPNLDQRSDVYSLAIVLYEMLAGEPPYTGPTAQAIVAKQLSQPVPSLRIVRETVPPGLEQAICRALAKVPADRFESVSGFARALVRAEGSPEPERAWSVPTWARGVVYAGLLATVATTVWRLVAADRELLDRNKIVVFPLVDRFPAGRDEPVGDVVALMIGSALEQTEPLTWIDGWTWLDAEQRKDVSELSAQAASEITRDRGAKFYAAGSVLHGRDSATVILRLHDVAGDSVIGQATVSGPLRGAAAAQLGLRAVGELLPRLLDPGRKLDLTVFTDRRPSAIANWLQGERAYRESRFAEALTYFDRAFASDSALQVAALKGAQAAHWENQDKRARELIDKALEGPNQLPAKHTHLAHGLRDYLSGHADSAVARARRAVGADSDWAEAWMVLGDLYYHLLPTGSPFLPLGAMDSLAEAALVNVRRLDPTFGPALLHLSELALRKGRVREAKQLVAAFRSLRPDTIFANELTLALECAAGGSPPMQSVAARRPADVLMAARILAAGATEPRCAETGFREVLASKDADLNYRWGALLGLHGLLVAQGRYEETANLLDSAARGGIPAAQGLYVLDAVAGADLQEQAAQVVSSLSGVYDSMGSERLRYHAVWEATQGSVERLAAIEQVLARKAAASGAPDDRLVADAVLARLSLVRGDTSAAVERFRAVIRDAPQTQALIWGFWESLAAERLLLSRLLLARNDAWGALRTADVFDHVQSVIFLIFLPASLEVRVAAARQMGDAETASKYLRRLQQLRANR